MLYSIFEVFRIYQLTWTSNVKYFFTFFIIITRKGSFIPNVFFGSAGHVMNVVLTFVPTISSTRLCISLSVIRLMCPFLTFLSQICNGLLPMLYRMDRKPDWKVFLNIIIYDNYCLGKREFCLYFLFHLVMWNYTYVVLSISLFCQNYQFGKFRASLSAP